jgi:hypothetical protein
LENNGRASSGKRTRHIDICYFFVMDKVHQNEVAIVYCPTEDMIADFFTKPLQGMQLAAFRDFIMNVDSGNKDAQNHRSVLEYDDTDNDVSKELRQDYKEDDTWTEVLPKH